MKFQNFILINLVMDAQIGPDLDPNRLTIHSDSVSENFF